MSAAERIIQFNELGHADATARAFTPANGAMPSHFQPSPEKELPFVLVALEEVRVKFGVMHTDTMSAAADLVEGDAWSLMGVTNMTPADTRLESGKLRVVLSSSVEVGRKSFAVHAPLDLVLMSACGKTLLCQHIEERIGGTMSRSFLLLPADFDAETSYELISKGA